MEREIILQALDSHRGNRTHTAKALGMSLRTLRHKLKLYRESGVDVTEFEPSAGGQLPSGKMLQEFPIDSVLMSEKSPPKLEGILHN